MKHKILIIASMLALLFTACTNNSVPTITATSTPELTHTPRPTKTPTPTSTPTPEPTEIIRKTVEVPGGGYSFQEPVGYDVEINSEQVGVYDKEETIIISITSGLYDSTSLSPDEVLDKFLSELFSRGEGEYQKSDAYPIVIGGVEGTAYDMTGTLFGTALEGQTVIVTPKENRYFFGFGVASTRPYKDRWESEGSVVFGDLLESVKFLSASQSDVSNVCKISSDLSYGYSQENPIRVGGDAFDGPARERAYLDNLLGPHGEQISYERKGSFSFQDTILDEFVLTGPGINATLYLDEYSFSEPEAPVSFTCQREFTLTKP